MRLCSKTEHDHWQSLEPVLAIATHFGDDCLDGSVPALYHPVCFGVVGWHGLILDFEDITLLQPVVGHEL